MQFSDRLSTLTGAQVYLKREDLQAVRSYKLRGAYNLMMQLSPAELAAGVVCSSAGNHAQGFALACRSMGVHGRVYVPAKTPKQKRDRIRYHGGEFIEVIVGGKTYDIAAAAAVEDVARTGATLVPPYDDLRTMAGQGTIAVEILEQLGSEPDLVIVPVGGGGCISGMTTYFAERTTDTSVLGVEPAGAAAMVAALATGEPVTLENVDQFVDGAAVARAGALPFAALTAAGDMLSITTVDEGAVCTAMLDLYQNEGIIAEPAGALSAAALVEADITPGSTVVCLVSGGNNDVSRYGEVLERSLVHLGLKHYFLVDFPQEPARCAGSSTRSSAPTTTSPCSSTSSATTATPARRSSASRWARRRTWRGWSPGCASPTATSNSSSRVRRPTATWRRPPTIAAPRAQSRRRPRRGLLTVSQAMHADRDQDAADDGQEQARLLARAPTDPRTQLLYPNPGLRRRNDEAHQWDGSAGPGQEEEGQQGKRLLERWCLRRDDDGQQREVVDARHRRCRPDGGRERGRLALAEAPYPVEKLRAPAWRARDDDLDGRVVGAAGVRNCCRENRFRGMREASTAARSMSTTPNAIWRGAGRMSLSLRKLW